MANAKDEQPKTVPPRNNLRKVEVYAQSKASQLQGKNPGFRYQHFSTDPKHPNYIGRYTQAHEIGNDEVGFAMVEPWEVVTAGEGVTQGRPRDDQGKPVDTVVRHGSMVLARTPVENYAVYEEIDRRKDAAKDKRLRQGDHERTASGGVYQARVAVTKGGYYPGNHRDLLNNHAGEGA